MGGGGLKGVIFVIEDKVIKSSNGLSILTYFTYEFLISSRVTMGQYLLKEIDEMLLVCDIASFIVIT